MEELVAVSLSYPTVVFTALLSLSLLYWLTVIFGFVGMDALDGAADGALEGAAEGAVEGAAEAAVEGAAEAAAEGAAEAAAEGAAEAATEGAAEAAGAGVGALGLLGGFQRSQAPVTLKFSLLFLCSWLLSYYASAYGGTALSALAPLPVWGSALLVLTPLVSMPLVGLALRPLSGVFVTHSATRRRHLIGQVVEVQTGRVDRAFGQASLEGGGASLLLQVRCDPKKLQRGDRALLVSYDDDSGFYEVEPYDDLINKS